MAQVFVVDRHAFFGGDWPQGFTALSERDAPAFLDRALAAGRFVERAAAETNPAWKQWIPYCALRCGVQEGRPDQDPGLFVVQRTGGQSEARLHGSWSIGLGGHIEPIDLPAGRAADQQAGGSAFFAASLWRELTEELRFEGDTASRARLRLLGLINDDSTAVGSVHAGLAYCLELQAPLARAREQVRIGEISKMRGGFTSLVEFAELWQDPARFESWSRIFLEAGIVAAMGGTTWRSTNPAQSEDASGPVPGS